MDAVFARRVVGGAKPMVTAVENANVPPAQTANLGSNGAANLATAQAEVKVILSF